MEVQTKKKEEGGSSSSYMDTVFQKHIMDKPSLIFYVSLISQKEKVN